MMADVDVELDKLMGDVERLIAIESPLVKSIKSTENMKLAIEKLKAMVGMDSVKRTVIDQMRFLIVNNARQGDEAAEQHMLHAVISGAPGTGKTTIAHILAQIWMAMGLIECTEETKPDVETIVKNTRTQLLDAACTVHDLHLRNYKALSASRNNMKVVRNAPYKQRPKLLSQTVAETQTFLREMSKELFDMSSATFDELFKKVPPLVIRDPKFTVASAPDLVGQYIGQTAIKTKQILDDALGGVLFIDEAYALVNPDSTKDFGKESLTVINEYMSKYPTRLIVIFAGYRDKLTETIFKVQPGLERRCQWHFNIDDYSPVMLARIFNTQLQKTGWSADPSVDIASLITNNAELFRFGGGSTEQFMFHCKLSYAASKFSETLEADNVNYDSVITESMMLKAITTMRDNTVTEKGDNPPPHGMYT